MLRLVLAVTNLLLTSALATPRPRWGRCKTATTRIHRKRTSSGTGRAWTRRPPTGADLLRHLDLRDRMPTRPLSLFAFLPRGQL